MLIASAGTTAPVTVPAAAVEVAGGAVSIGLMTEAEAAVAAAIMGLIWAGLPEALMAGLEGFAATEVLGHIALHPPTTVTLPTTHPNVPTNNGPQITINEVRSHQEDLPLAGKAVGPYVYVPPKRAKGDPAKAWNRERNGFEDAKGNIWVWDKLHDNHWDVQDKGSDKTYTNVNPDGTKGQGKAHHRR